MLTENELIKFRRELHSYPETGWCEFVTTHKIVEKLRSFGLDPIYGRQVINPEFVAGRNPAKVEEAKKAALEKGVPPEFIESMQGYTGVAAISKPAAPALFWQFVSTWTALTSMKLTKPVTVRSTKAGQVQIRAICTPAAMTVIQRWVSQSATGFRKTWISSAARSRSSSSLLKKAFAVHAQ